MVTKWLRERFDPGCLCSTLFLHKTDKEAISTLVRGLMPCSLTRKISFNNYHVIQVLIPGYLNSQRLYKRWVERLCDVGYDCITIGLDYETPRISLRQQAEGVVKEINKYKLTGYTYIHIHTYSLKHQFVCKDSLKSSLIYAYMVGFLNPSPNTFMLS